MSAASSYSARHRRCGRTTCARGGRLLERRELPEPLERGPDVAGAHDAAGRVVDAGTQDEAVGPPAVLWPGQRHREVWNDLGAVASGGALHRGEAVSGDREQGPRRRGIGERGIEEVESFRSAQRPAASLHDARHPRPGPLPIGCRRRRRARSGGCRARSGRPRGSCAGRCDRQRCRTARRPRRRPVPRRWQFGAVADRDRRRDDGGPRRDPRDGAVEVVGDPHRVVPDRDPARTASHVDHLHDASASAGRVERRCERRRL